MNKNRHGIKRSNMFHSLQKSFTPSVQPLKNPTVSQLFPQFLLFVSLLASNLHLLTVCSSNRALILPPPLLNSLSICLSPFLYFFSHQSRCQVESEERNLGLGVIEGSNRKVSVTPYLSVWVCDVCFCECMRVCLCVSPG